MGSKVTIKIRKRSFQGKLVWLLIFLPLCMGTLNDLLGLPYGIRYLLDVVWLMLLFIMVAHRQSAHITGISGLKVWVLLFFAVTLAVFPVQYQSPAYYLWGVRNNFRFYVAFFAFITYLTREETEHCLKWFDILFWIDIAVSFVQHFAFGWEQDHLGGLFGVGDGVNGSANIFFLFIVARSVVLYLEKKEKLWVCAAKCIASLVVAAMAELKFYYVEVLLVMIIAVLLTNFTWRKILIILGGGAAIVLGATLLSLFFPGWGDWFSLKWFLESATSNSGYTGHGDLNRLNAISQINELWLKEWPQRIFGMGLGNCDTSSFAFVNTPFFRQHGDMHYTWISYAMIYLETGYVGLIFYFGFFVLVFLQTRKLEKRSDEATKTQCHIAQIMAIMCMVISVYNASLRAEAGYMAYFTLAIPFVFGKYPQHKDAGTGSQQKVGLQN